MNARPPPVVADVSRLPGMAMQHAPPTSSSRKPRYAASNAPKNPAPAAAA